MSDLGVRPVCCDAKTLPGMASWQKDPQLLQGKDMEGAALSCSASDMSRLYCRNRREDRKAKNVVFALLPPLPAARTPDGGATSVA